METTTKTEFTPADKQWITELYHAYAPRCLRSALAVLKDGRLAEEAVQETWLKAVTLTETASRADVERQLFTILKHTCLDILRKEKRYVPLPEGWDTPAEDKTQEGLLEQVTRLIRNLPEKYRQVLELKYLGECSNQEIAQRLKLRESTVSTRVQRGREQLMNALKKEGFFHDGGGI